MKDHKALENTIFSMIICTEKSCTKESYSMNGSTCACPQFKCKHKGYSPTFNVETSSFLNRFWIHFHHNLSLNYEMNAMMLQEGPWGRHLFATKHKWTSSFSSLLFNLEIFKIVLPQNVYTIREDFINLLWFLGVLRKTFEGFTGTS